MHHASYFDARDGLVHSVRPYYNQVVIQRTPLSETTPTGLYILGREWPAHGRVLAVGPVRTRYGIIINGELEPGDEVAFDKWSAENKLIPGSEDVLIIDRKFCFLRLREYSE